MCAQPFAWTHSLLVYLQAERAENCNALVLAACRRPNPFVLLLGAGGTALRSAARVQRRQPGAPCCRPIKFSTTSCITQTPLQGRRRVTNWRSRASTTWTHLSTPPACCGAFPVHAASPHAPPDRCRSRQRCRRCGRSWAVGVSLTRSSSRLLRNMQVSCSSPKRLEPSRGVGGRPLGGGGRLGAGGGLRTCAQAPETSARAYFQHSALPPCSRAAAALGCTGALFAEAAQPALRHRARGGRRSWWRGVEHKLRAGVWAATSSNGSFARYTALYASVLPATVSRSLLCSQPHHLSKIMSPTPPLLPDRHIVQGRRCLAAQGVCVQSAARAGWVLG